MGNITCKFCGKTGLVWFDVEGAKHLFEEDGKPHTHEPKHAIDHAVGDSEMRSSEEYVVPCDEDLDKMTLAELRELANQMKCGVDGKRSGKDDPWRATARKDQLIRALKMMRSGGRSEQGGQHGDCNWKEIDRRIGVAIPKAKVVVAEIEEKVNHRFNTLRDELIARVPVRIELPTGEIKEVGRQHVMFNTLLELMRREINVFLVGPAGSGKTTAIVAAAEALGKRFHISSMSSQTPESRMYGYNDATGRYVPGILFSPYTEGYVLGLDELDNSNANVLAALNSALSNQHLGFPHGMFARGTGFTCVASGNTYGMGANRVYVGRQQIDGATLDRFVVLEWPYDETFENDLALSHAQDAEQERRIREWVLKVQAYRHAADKLGIRHIISPRASLNGAKLIATNSNIPMDTMEKMLVWRGLESDSITKIKGDNKSKK